MDPNANAGGDVPTQEARRLLFASRDGLGLTTKTQATARRGAEWEDFTGPIIAIDKATNEEIGRGRVTASRTCLLGMVTLAEIERMGDVAQRNPIGFGIAMERFYSGITVDNSVVVLAFELDTPADGFGGTPPASEPDDGAENAEG